MPETQGEQHLKRCSLCKEEKPLDNFTIRRDLKDGRKTRCRACVKALNKRYRELNPDAFRKSVRESQRSRREKGLVPPVEQTPEQRKRHLEAQRRYAQRHREKVAAHEAVGEAIRTGKLIRPPTCEECGGSDKRIEAHHPDYAKQLEVRWLCTTCHGLAHRL